MTKRRQWPDEHMLDALRMRDEGMPVDQIARTLGYSKGSVCGVLKRVRDDSLAAEGRQEAQA
mgnify:CR=1 FL=1